jgi:phosphatidylglycerophosphatase C
VNEAETTNTDGADTTGTDRPADRRRIAAFDFDGTVTKRDTLVPFVAQVAGPARFAAVCGRLGLSGARRRVDLMARDDVKAELARLVFRGRTEDEIRARADRYGTALLASRLRPFMVDRVTAHVDAGHDTLFVSASLTYYIEPIAEALGMNAVIAVELETVDGMFTGELARPNVRADEKVVRLEEWTAATGGADRELWSYGNSSGDHALLAAADHAFWLGRPTKAPPRVVAISAQVGPPPLTPLR